MRVVLTFCFLTMGLTVCSPGQQASVPDGRRLKLGAHCYTMTAKAPEGLRVAGVTFQSVSKTKVGSVDALAIVVHQHLSNGKFDMRDSFLVRLHDLRPIRLDTERDGKPHAHLDYTDEQVTGWKMAGETREIIQVSVKGPVWDGNLWGETFAALPLKSNTSITLPTYQYDSGFGNFAIDVFEQHPEQTAFGVIQAWRLKVGLSRSQQTEYTVSTDPGIEIGYTAGPSSQRIGGDCTDVH